MSETWQDIFDASATFDPAGDLDAFLKCVPARWVVYLLCDAEARPVQLLCVKNLRASLKRRLGGEDTVGPTRRVNYRELVRSIHWRRVDSAFESDWIYFEAARVVFPQSYRGMVGFRPAWFLHVDPDAPFPRWVKTIDLSERAGVYVGPVEDKQSAQKLIQLVEDCFDLCRYHNILVEAPFGKACAYKEMGKCPAPCDGSIEMDQYRHLIDWSAKVVVDPADFVREHERRMQQAASEQNFEAAGRIKQYVEQLSHFARGPFRHARRLNDFIYISLQRGPRNATAKLYLITPGLIEEVVGLVCEPLRTGDIMRQVLERAEHRTNEPVDVIGAERIGVVTHHLFAAKKAQGVFLPLDRLDEKSILRAFRDVQKQKVVDVSDDEGIVKELVAM